MKGSFEGLFGRALWCNMQGFLESCLFVVVNNNFFLSVMPSCCRERCTVQKSEFMWPRVFTTCVYHISMAMLCRTFLGHIKGSYDELFW